MTQDKLQSPYAGLQAMLGQLGRLSPSRGQSPFFSDRDAAEHVIAISGTATGAEVALAGVWAIDHEDLEASEIVGWTVTSLIN